MRSCGEPYEEMMRQIEDFGVLYGKDDGEWSEEAEADGSLAEAFRRLKRRCEAFEAACGQLKERQTRLLGMEGIPALMTGYARRCLKALEDISPLLAAAAEVRSMLDEEDPRKALRRAAAILNAGFSEEARECADPEGHITVIQNIMASAMEVIRYYDAQES